MEWGLYSVLFSKGVVIKGKQGARYHVLGKGANLGESKFL